VSSITGFSFFEAVNIHLDMSKPGLRHIHYKQLAGPLLLCSFLSTHAFVRNHLTNIFRKLAGMGRELQGRHQAGIDTLNFGEQGNCLQIDGFNIRKSTSETYYETHFITSYVPSIT